MKHNSIMPRNEIDYSKTIIYKIVCNDLNIKDLYVGSTTNFRARKNKHKSSCNSQTTYKIYEVIRANGGWDNWTMLEIEKFSCQDNNEARTRERFWYEQLNPTLNTILPIATEEDEEKRKEYYAKYRDEHVEEIKNYHANNYIKKKEEIDARNKKYREENAEKEKQRQAKWREENKESIKIKNAKKYEENKEKIKARNAKWRAENPEKEKERGAKRRAIKKAEIMS